jgi:tRNA-specific adenosine deaminase 3
MLYGINIEPILENELSTNPPLMRVVVADLAGSRKDLTKIFQLTKDLTPLEELKHLRRVRETGDGRIECILTKIRSTNASTDTDQAIIDSTRKILEDAGLVLKDYRIVDVPSRAAKTEAQVEACSKIWPTKFSKCHYLIKCMDGSIINETERLVVRILVNSLIEYIKSPDCKFTSGAVIFRYAKVYGASLCCQATSRSNPTKHSAMIAIDSVAKNAGAGHWPAETHYDGDQLSNRMQQLLDDRREFDDHKIDANFIPYICTNYDIVVTEEPCMMCTMGLIQSRIRRLFYLDAASLSVEAQSRASQASFMPVCYPDKAIEEFLIHRDKSINHRFEAWRIKLLPVG